MSVIVFIIGVFLVWQGEVQISKKMTPWPKSKKIGRVIGGLLMLPLIIEMFVILLK